MTHQDQISSYFDGGLSMEQEQEFLISLAASEGLRKTFRSDLVLQGLVHQDELRIAPPREMRAAVFAAIGLGLGATALTSSRAEAAGSATTAPKSPAPAPTTPMTFIRGLVGTKVNAIITAGGVFLSGLAGYAVHDMVSHPATPVTVTTPISVSQEAVQQPVFQSPNAVPAPTVAAKPTVAKHHATKRATDVKSVPSGMTGNPTMIGSEDPVK